MKRWISILAAFVCIIAISGCDKEKEKEQAYFNARVVEVNEEAINVCCIETFNSEIPVDEEILVTRDKVSAKETPELNIDDDIRIVFDGDVKDSNPLQIGTVYEIYLLDENGEVI